MVEPSKASMEYLEDAQSQLSERQAELGLSRVELDVLHAIAELGTAPAAAEAIDLSIHTIEGHLKSIRLKSGYHHLPQLVTWGIQRGWLDPETLKLSASPQKGAASSEKPPDPVEEERRAV